MVKNYIKIAWRNLTRNKVYSLINITGLTIGLAACLLVATVVIDDLSYDHQWKNADHIFRIISVDNSSKLLVDRFPRSFAGLGPELKKDFPEVKDFARMDNTTERLRLNDDKDGIKMKSISTDPSVWSLLDFEVVQGTPQKFVKGYVNLVITDKIKIQYFANTSPIGKVITNIPQFGTGSKYLITGIIKEIPANTHLRADVLEITQSRTGDDQLNKGEFGSFYQQYVLLKPGTDIKAFTAKVNHWYQHDIVTGKKATYSFEFQPMTDIYLRSDFPGASYAQQGSIRNVYIFSGVAILLLLIACINFINLTTARALKRVREVGIRKVLGASMRELVAQFLFESLLFFLISFVGGILLYSLFLKSVETYLGHALTLTLQSNGLLLLSTSGCVLLVSVVTGLYPAFVISVQNPVSTIKGQPGTNTSGSFLRKGLVVAQFSISVVVLLATIIVQNQLHFMDHKDLGFDKNNLLRIDDTNWGTKSTAFKQEVLKLSGVEKASMSNWYPSSGSGGTMSMSVDDPDQKNNKIKVWYINADQDFAATLGFHLQKGRFFDPKLSTDVVNADSLMHASWDAYEAAGLKQPVLVTAYTAKVMHIKELNKPTTGLQGIPIGIINDFHNESLHTDMKPVLIRAASSISYGSLLVRTRAGAQQPLLAGIFKIWQQFFPDKVFQFSWVDDLLKDQYKAEQKLQQLFTLFSFLILFLACLGLFGLTAFTAELRVKEIGIRKVLGASVAGITALLSRDFIKLVALSIVIASPIAWYAMSQWLQSFAYRITIQWWVFAIAGAMAVLVALVTISFQSVKAALANPVKSLRSE